MHLCRFMLQSGRWRATWKTWRLLSRTQMRESSCYASEPTAQSCLMHAAQDPSALGNVPDSYQQGNTLPLRSIREAIHTMLSLFNRSPELAQLCRVVGDLMKSAGMRLGSVAELETYIRRPRDIGSGSIPVRSLPFSAIPPQEHCRGSHKSPYPCQVILKRCTLLHCGLGNHPAYGLS